MVRLRRIGGEERRRRGKEKQPLFSSPSPSQPLHFLFPSAVPFILSFFPSQSPSQKASEEESNFSESNDKKMVVGCATTIFLVLSITLFSCSRESNELARHTANV